MKELNPDEKQKIINTLKARFQENPGRHEGILWVDVETRLNNAVKKLWSLNEMEASGGEPDVVGRDEKSGSFIFFDCSPESPSGRRGLCYDGEALESRKSNKPKGSALDAASSMGIQILTEDQYRYLQGLGQFDEKTSSRVSTPDFVRKLGGALFCDRRYDMVFVYHNGAGSYYSSRGFRGWIQI